MSKGLEALHNLCDIRVAIHKRIEKGTELQFSIANGDDYVIIEKELKAFDIMKNKRVDVYEFIKCSKSLDKLERYNRYASCDDYQLTREEFDLLKEVLCNE